MHTCVGHPTDSMKKTEASFRSIESIYKSLDSDHNGLLTRKELKTGLNKLGLPVDESSLTNLFQSLGLHEKKGITLPEFESFCEKRSAELKAAFDEIDTNHNGTIEWSEIQTSLQKAGLPAAPEDVNRLMRRMDKNHTSDIDYDEWREFLMFIPEANQQALVRYWANASLLFVDEMIVPQDPFKSWVDTGKLMLAGGLAGTVSKTLTAPLERLKVLYQVHHSVDGKKPPPPIAYLKSIYQESGWKGFFRGNGAAVLKIAPEMALKMTVYDKLKAVFSEDDAAVKPWQRFVAGGTAGAVCHTLVFPLEVIKLRLAVTPTGTYNGIVDAVTKISATEGKVRPFYRGLVPCLLNTVPHNGINLTLYELLKEEVVKRGISGPEPGAGTLAACSGSASVIGQVICYPLHVVMARLATQGTPGRPILYKGTADCFIKLYHKEGMKSFYRGMGVSFIKSVPAHSISLTTYEYMKRFLNASRANASTVASAKVETDPSVELYNEDEYLNEIWLSKNGGEDRILHKTSAQFQKSKKKMIDCVLALSRVTVQCTSDPVSCTNVTCWIYPRYPFIPTIKKEKNDVEWIVASDGKKEFVKRMREAQREITYNFPNSLNLKLGLSDDMMLPLSPYKVLSPIEAFIDTYKAQCNALQIQPPSTLFCYYLENLVRHSEVSLPSTFDLDLTDCPGANPDSELSINFTPIMHALRHDNFFKSVILRDCSRREICGLLGDTLSWNCCLTKLILSNINADTSSVISLCAGLEVNRSHCLSVIDLSQNPKIGDRGIAQLASALSKFTKGMSSINVNNTGLTPRGISEFLLGMENNWGLSLTLESIDLSNNRFDEVSSSNFERWIGLMNEHSSLKRIALSNTGFTTGLSNEWKEAFRYIPNLRDLDLSGTRMDHAGAEASLTFLVEGGPSLQKLNISSSGVGAQAVANILHASTKRTNALEILLAGNQSVDAIDLSMTLSKASVITSLDLSQIHFREKQFVSLISSVMNGRVTSLYLDNVFQRPPTEVVANSLCVMLSNTASLRTLSLNGGYMRHNIIPVLRVLETSNHSLTSLSITHNKLGDFGAEAISHCLRFNCFLNYLDCDNNQITLTGWQTICSGLKLNKIINHIEYPSADLERSPSHGLIQMMLTLHTVIKKGFSFKGMRKEDDVIMTPQQTVPLAVVPEYLASLPSMSYPKERFGTLRNYAESINNSLLGDRSLHHSGSQNSAIQSTVAAAPLSRTEMFESTDSMIPLIDALRSTSPMDKKETIDERMDRFSREIQQQKDKMIIRSASGNTQDDMDDNNSSVRGTQVDDDSETRSDFDDSCSVMSGPLSTRVNALNLQSMNDEIFYSPASVMGTMRSVRSMSHDQ
ncbi:EF-hand domain-containing protein [Planoprotostelium fungivorum]|uniref:EF-hand domain-containing protein n=1 Tax=Planoprotostelium fungivorum TaxID=1890364 RepID=A0A2P6NGP6_9EUKA|nr:EF-hand domain-containing protein [Planoprotostelium fungivorum]